MPLKNLDISIVKGEFVCVIGDVGSGKTSLLQAIIGDLIYLPQAEIDTYGGSDKFGKKKDYDDLKKRLLSKELKFEAPVKVDGSIAYVE